MSLPHITLCAAALLAAPLARADQPSINDPAAYTSAPLITTIPQQLSMDTSLGSIHFPAGLAGQPRFNDFNPGLGLEWPLTSRITAMTGIYRNSYDHTSAYLGLAYLPRAWRLQPGGWRWLVRPGFMAGLVSGYSHSENPAMPFFGAGLLQIRDTQSGVGLNLIGLPQFDGQAGFVGLQIVTRSHE